MSFRFGVMSEEFIGSARYSRYKMAGRQFGWYRGFSRPLGMRGFFITRLHSGKLGGTARREARPMGRFSFLFP